MGWLFTRIYDGMMREVERAALAGWRASLLAEAYGRVLEVGAGTGANLPYYTRRVEQLVASEPDRHMRAALRFRAQHVHVPIEVTDDGAERLAWADGTFDFVVSTLVLCSVSDLEAALGEIRRVLKPGGRLLFIEHVAAEDHPERARWQRRIEPLWRRFAGNCHLTRDTARAIDNAGFSIQQLSRQSMPKAMPLVRPTIRGIAVVPLDAH